MLLSSCTPAQLADVTHATIPQCQAILDAFRRIAPRGAVVSLDTPWAFMVYFDTDSTQDASALAPISIYYLRGPIQLNFQGEHGATCELILRESCSRDDLARYRRAKTKVVPVTALAHEIPQAWQTANRQPERRSMLHRR